MANNIIVVKLKFNKSSFRALSNICASIAQVSFGALVGGIVLTSLDATKLLVLILELIFSLGFWYLSLFYAEKGKL